MKLSYTTRNGRLTAEFDTDTQADLWRQLARFQEVFEDTTCRKGDDESDNVVFTVRMNGDDEYFELRCKDVKGPLAGVKKAISQHKKGGGLYAKSKDKEGNWLPDNGWVRYNSETQKEE